MQFEVPVVNFPSPAYHEVRLLPLPDDPIRKGRVGIFQVPSMKLCYLVDPWKVVFSIMVLFCGKTSSRDMDSSNPAGLLYDKDLGILPGG